jgi:hypothetical protein
MIETIEKIINSKTFTIATYACTLLVVKYFLGFEFATFIGISTIVANLKR